MFPFSLCSLHPQICKKRSSELKLVYAVFLYSLPLSHHYQAGGIRHVSQADDINNDAIKNLQCTIYLEKFFLAK